MMTLGLSGAIAVYLLMSRLTNPKMKRMQRHATLHFETLNSPFAFHIRLLTSTHNLARCSLLLGWLRSEVARTRT